MNWIEEWAKTKVIGAWIILGIIVIALIAVIIMLVKEPLNRYRVNRFFKKRFAKIFSDVKKRDTVYVISDYYQRTIDEVHYQKATRDEEKSDRCIIYLKTEPPCKKRLDMNAYGVMWAFTKEELEEEK